MHKLANWEYFVFLFSPIKLLIYYFRKIYCKCEYFLIEPAMT